MRRRDFLALAGTAGAALTLPGPALAQAKVPRVVLVSGVGTTDQMRIGAGGNWDIFLEYLRGNGFVEGRSVTYDRHVMTAGTTDQNEANARVALAVAPDLIVWFGTPSVTLAAATLSKTIAMVSWQADLLAQGVVSNVARPGGNVTGISVNASADFEGKMLSLLSQAVPAAKSFAYANSGVDGQFRATALASFRSVTEAAARIGLKMVPIVYAPGGGEGEWIKVLAAARSGTLDMVVFGTDSPLSNLSQQANLASLALAAKMPTIGAIGQYAEAGGLAGYGGNYPQMARDMGNYATLILRGAKPGDLPVLQPAVWDFVVNVRTARAIGLTIPPSILAQATKVIE